MTRDAQGLEVNASSEAVAELDKALAQCNSWSGDPLLCLRRAVDFDPGFVLAYSTEAALLALSGVPGWHPTLRAALKSAQDVLERADPREEAHFAAAAAWARGDIVAAAAIWEQLLLDAPMDALALKFAHDSYFYLGHSASLRDSIARVLPQWDSDCANYGYVLGQYAFGLEECGDLASAEQNALKALERNAADAWAVHALAHVFETRCRPTEGLEFLRATRPSWKAADALAVHLGWHAALYLIELGDVTKVLADYDKFVAPRLALDSLLDLVDASSLLWRIELVGGDVGGRWRPLADQWLKHLDDHVLVFNDLHLAMSVIRGTDTDAERRLRGSLAAYAGRASGDNREITIDIGSRLIDGVCAFAMEDYAHCIDCLMPVRYKFVRIGGSHAQRDVLTQTLIVAAERAGRVRLLRALLAERLALRPTPRLQLAYAAVEHR